jgi:hypothetical protein
MRSRMGLCVVAVLGALGGNGPAQAQDSPKGKPPLLMKVVQVNDDELVVERSVRAPDDPLVTVVRSYRRAFSDLRAFDKHGTPLALADWKGRLKPGLEVYVAADERKVAPAHLRKAPGHALVLWGVVVQTPEPLDP